MALFKKQISAALARRLAEAADGFRNVPEVFFIANYTFPHEVIPFPTFTEAENYFSAQKLDEKDWDIFGPYHTEDNAKTPKGAEDIEKVVVKILFKDGQSQETTIDGEIDTIFFNLSALDKFAIPYYCSLFGADYAKALRDSIIKNMQQSNTRKGQVENSSSSFMILNPHSTVTYL